jgi:hypothetical protein
MQIVYMYRMAKTSRTRSIVLFENWMQRAGMSEMTTMQYASCVRSFEATIKRDANRATDDECRTYLRALPSRWSVRRALSALRAFYRFSKRRDDPTGTFTVAAVWRSAPSIEIVAKRFRADGLALQADRLTWAVAAEIAQRNGEYDSVSHRLSGLMRDLLLRGLPVRSGLREFCDRTSHLVFTDRGSRR